MRSEADEHLACVDAAEHVEERLRGVADAVDDGLLVTQPTILDQRRDLGEEPLAQVEVVGDEETADRQALADDLPRLRGAAGGSVAL